MHLPTPTGALTPALLLSTTASALHSRASLHKSLVTEILERRALKPRSEHFHNHVRAHTSPVVGASMEFVGFGQSAP